MKDITTKKIKKIFTVKWVVYLSLIFSIFIYFFISVMLKNYVIKSLADGTMIVVLRNAFGGLSVILLLISFYIRKILSNPERFIQILQGKELDKESIKKITKSTDDETIKKIGGIILYSNTIDIISWMLCESIATLGLILSLMSGDMVYVQAFGAIALIALSFERPDFSGFMDLVQKALDKEKEASKD